jgi:hypothetical protein
VNDRINGMAARAHSLQFSDTDIEAGAKAIIRAEVDRGRVTPINNPNFEQLWVNCAKELRAQAIDTARAVLRAAEAVSARSVIVPAAPGLEGELAAPGDYVEGIGDGGRTWRGEVIHSATYTTTIRREGTNFEQTVWTRTLHNVERPGVVRT